MAWFTFSHTLLPITGRVVIFVVTFCSEVMSFMACEPIWRTVAGMVTDVEPNDPAMHESPSSTTVKLLPQPSLTVSGMLMGTPIPPLLKLPSSSRLYTLTTCPGLLPLPMLFTL